LKVSNIASSIGLVGGADMIAEPGINVIIPLATDTPYASAITLAVSASVFSIGASNQGATVDVNDGNNTGIY
jgi:hypothetical protein